MIINLSTKKSINTSFSIPKAIVYFFVFVCISLISFSAFAQDAIIKGKLIDAETAEPLTGASVVLLNLSDSTMKGMISKPDGSFFLPKVMPGKYLLRLTFVGYEKLEQNIEITEQILDLDVIELSPKTETLNEVVVEHKLPLAVQKGDTTEYNSAAFKTNPDADAEDLVKKMPGIVISNGQVQAQGEAVQEVLVDGKKFFGNDPTLALKSLPAEVIDKIQVYDKMSDQSQFTGFDDGQRTKTINIITKPDKRNGQFGKIYGGVGTNERYNAGGTINLFNGEQRTSIIGQSNNINLQNFSNEDLLGVVSSNSRNRRFGGGGGGRGGRPGGGGRGGRRGGGAMGGDVNDFLVGQQNGLSNTHALGINYIDKWGEKVEVNGSYFFNMSGNTLYQSTNQEFIIPDEENQFYEEINNTQSDNYNNRLNLRIDYKIDSFNSILIMPSLSFQKNMSDALVEGNTTQFGELLSQTANETINELGGYNFSNNLLYRHRFKKQRRTLSISLTNGLNSKDGENSLDALNYFPSDVPVYADTIDQLTDINNNGYSVGTSIRYTEPISKKGMLQLNYDLNYSDNQSDRKTYSFNPELEEHSELDSLLSNVFKSKYTTQGVGGGYMHRGEKYFFMVRANYQTAKLDNSQQFPNTGELNYTFNNVLPMAMMMYRFSRQKNLRIFYRTNTQQPSVDQLQNVLDNSNPLQLSIGNPNLNQQYQHMAMLRYSASNLEKSNTFFAFISASSTDNYIGNSTLIASRDTVILGDIEMNAGSQLSQPINLDGYKNIRSFITYGVPVSGIKSNINLNAGVSYSKIPSMVNGLKNFSGSTDMTASIVLSSNISEKVDFTLSSTSLYNITKNSTQETLNNTYVNQASKGEIYWMFYKNLVFRTDLTHQYYVGLSEGFDQNYLLWNMSIAKKLFKADRGEIKLSVFDLLNQNTSITRNVNDAYIEDVRTNVLQRFYMVTFTYRLRHFKI
ncbi:TonB-dependent receptor [Flexithrix dorotheae]|uniref:TonB-dependent receptor n=1 Tax=Flexithrix dorotheae TaxID=70993 RepID=UPI000380DC54|nr:TonB-dependent receptor [Flexithrix dorotheae]